MSPARNHVLPTARSARFSSGLGVLDFMKRTSILKCGPDQLRALGPAAIALGEAEGLEAHARSVAMRFNPPDERRLRRDAPGTAKDSNRLVAVTLDENSIGRSKPDVEHERAVAIYDLLEDNIFAPKDDDEGPFALHLSITGSRLVFDIRRATARR